MVREESFRNCNFQKRKVKSVIKVCSAILYKVKEGLLIIFLLSLPPGNPPTSAPTPENEVCPLEGSYTLRGLVSPPYSSASRHKRNHNSKLHNNHHHLHDLSSLDGKIANNNFKAHTSLSFRNEEESLKSWHLNDRNKSLRQRRSLLLLRDESDEQSTESDSNDSIPLLANGAYNDVSDDGSEVSNIDDDEVIKLVRNKRNNNKLSVEADEDLESLGTNANINDPSRSRRDATINCGGSVNTKTRQLNIGCSDENKIDVSPQCNDEGEEGEY